VPGKPSAEKVAEMLAEIQKMPICDDCDVLRGANLFVAKQFGQKKAALFDKNLDSIMTTHVDLGCNPCPVDEIMKLFRKNRLAAIAAIL